MDLFAAQGTLTSLLQHHSSKASILQCSAFFTVQLSHPYMTTGKTIALTRRTFVGKVSLILKSLLFNMLSRLVITFLPSSKHLLISWLQSLSAVILEPKKIKSVTVSIVPHVSAMTLNAIIFVYLMLSFKPAFTLSSFTFIKMRRTYSPSLLTPSPPHGVASLHQVPPPWVPPLPVAKSTAERWRVGRLGGGYPETPSSCAEGFRFGGCAA